MPRLPAIQPDKATGKAKELLDGVQAKLKITPNMTRVMANSPAVLQAYLSFTSALAGRALDAKLREQIALEVGEQNACQYCVSAHTAIGRMVGLSDPEIAAARGAASSSPKNAAALEFARHSWPSVAWQTMPISKPFGASASRTPKSRKSSLTSR